MSSVMRGVIPALLLTAVGACTGRIDDDASDPPGEPEDRAPGRAAAPKPGASAAIPLYPACAAPVRGAPALRRLTHPELDRTTRDLFGRKGTISAALPADGAIDGFDNDARALVVSTSHTERYRDAAEQLATEVVTAARKSAGAFELIGCDVRGAGRAACLRQFVTGFGRRVFRRPLVAVEIDGLLAVAAAAEGDPDPFAAVASVVEALLQSPSFLYRVELGTPDPRRPGQFRLGPYDLATRLSYVLWGTTPDVALLDAAASGALANADGVAARARLMLGDPRAREAVRDFHEQWSHARALPDLTATAELTQPLRRSMAEETRRFLDEVLWNGSVLDLLDARFTFVDSALAKHYGLPGPATAGFSRQELTAIPRAGLLTQAGVLSVHGREEVLAPILRGKFVREAVLCQPPPPPPDDVPALPEASAGMSVRQRLEAHRTNPACAACHGAMDPIGFGLENYDVLGRHRTVDRAGQPLTGQGRLEGTADPAFTGGVELGRKLRDAPGVPGCFVRQYQRFAFGRADTAQDSCGIDAVTAAFAASGHRFPALLEALVRSEGFLFATSASEENDR